MIRITAIVLALLLFASTSVADPGVDKNSFNLIGVNKSDFKLIQGQASIPAPPLKLFSDPIKIKEEPKAVAPKEEPKAKPALKVGEMYQDNNGTWRRKAEDDQGDWLWDADNRRWYRWLGTPPGTNPGVPPARKFNPIIPRTTPQAPSCPSGGCSPGG